MSEQASGGPDGRSPDDPLDPLDRLPVEDDGGMYGVFGEGRPRRIVGDSDEPPRRRPRRRPGAAQEEPPSP